MPKLCIITGSSKGIGLGIAKYLASQPAYQVVLNSRQPLDQKVLDEFSDAKHPVGQMIGDISDFDESKQMVQQVIEEYGPVSVLVNNAGINKDGLFMRMKEEDFNQVVQTNLNGTFNMSRHLMSHFLKQKAGTIVNISSVVGITGNAGQANYAASKAGVLGLTKSLAKEVGSRQITINAVAPGFIETEMTDQLSDKHKQAALDMIPLARYGRVDEVAHAVEFLIENSYMTGQVLEVNGGLHM